MNDVSSQMRAEWNERAREDAHYYVAFGGRNQDEEGFRATASQVVAAMETELKRLRRNSNPRTWRALEIGCGPGRLMGPLSRNFGEIHGVDVADEMIGIARQRLRDIPHAHVHATNGASLNLFADESFDLVYSFAVFQHIPSREVVFEYMGEICRVLKPGGIFRGQFNGLPPQGPADTWSGVSLTGGEIREFTSSSGLQLLALEGVRTQYMWTTWRKPESVEEAAPHPVTIRRITNTFSSETVVPNRGAMAAMSVWIANLPEACDLNTLEVRIDGQSATAVYAGPAGPDSLRQVNVMVPPGTRTGLVPVELRYQGAALGPKDYVRMIPAGPLVPRIMALTDGINLVLENRTISGIVKVQLEEVLYPETVEVDVDGLPVDNLEIFCTDPLLPRHEVNFTLPETIASGSHQLQLRLGRRLLPVRELIVERN